MFSSPYYPGHYPPNINCTWNIEVGAGLGVLEKREREGKEGEVGGRGTLQMAEERVMSALGMPWGLRGRAHSVALISSILQTQA